MSSTLFLYPIGLLQSWTSQIGPGEIDLADPVNQWIEYRSSIWSLKWNWELQAFKAWSLNRSGAIYQKWSRPRMWLVRVKRYLLRFEVLKVTNQLYPYWLVRRRSEERSVRRHRSSWASEDRLWTVVLPA